MKRFIILLAMLSLLMTSLLADEWVVSTDMAFTLSESYYSDNWQGEEIGNITWVFTSHTKADKKLSDLYFWRNNLRLAFGQTHQQGTSSSGDKVWEKPTKSKDKIDFDSMLKLTFNQYVDPFIAFRWESQFLDSGSISDKDAYLINPNRFTESIGIAKDFINVENHRLSSRLGAAFRQKHDRKLEEDNLTYDGGIESITEYSKRFVKHGINFDSRLLLYQALMNSKEYEDNDPTKDYWKELDITWENTITTKIWSVINMVFNFDLIYDKEEHVAGQFRQNLGIGIAWQL